MSEAIRFDVNVSIDVFVECAECGYPVESSYNHRKETLSVAPCGKCLEEAKE